MSLHLCQLLVEGRESGSRGEVKGIEELCDLADAVGNDLDGLAVVPVLLDLTLHRRHAHASSLLRIQRERGMDRGREGWREGGREGERYQPTVTTVY